MNDLWQAFVLTFLPLFIVINPLSKVPVIISMSEGMTQREQRRLDHLAVITAAGVGFVFLFFGHWILRVLNISVGSFAIAGGVVLLVLSITYMTTGRMVEVVKEDMVAVVPIGTPLTVGPATVTTLILLADQFPLYIVLLSFVLNLLITWVTFLFSGHIVKFIGQNGIRAISRVFSLLLAAIAVSMVVRGLEMLGILSTSL